jgi:cytochrome c-type biogenesis protein CcmE
MNKRKRAMSLVVVIVLVICVVGSMVLTAQLNESIGYGARQNASVEYVYENGETQLPE